MTDEFGSRVVYVDSVRAMIKAYKLNYTARLHTTIADNPGRKLENPNVDNVVSDRRRATSATRITNPGKKFVALKRSHGLQCMKTICCKFPASIVQKFIYG